MTATMPERPTVDVDALNDDIRAVLDAHGLTGAHLTVTPVTQGGLFAGVTVNAYRRPEGLPEPERLTREEENARYVDSFKRVMADLSGPRRPSLRVLNGGAA